MNIKAFTQSDLLILKKDIIKLNAPGLLGGNYTFGYERMIGKKMTINVMIGYIDFNIMNPSRFSQAISLAHKPSLAFTDEINGIIFIPETRFYFKNYRNKFPGGHYISLFFRYKYLQHDFKDIRKTSSIYWAAPPGDTMNLTHTGISHEISTGLSYGFQIIDRKGRTIIEWFTGLQIKYVSVDRKYENTLANDDFLKQKYSNKNLFNGLQPEIRLGVNIGLSFKK